MANAPLTCADLDEIERERDFSEAQWIALLALARQGVAAQELAEALTRCAEATPSNTNSATPAKMASWVHAVANTALASFRAATSASSNPVLAAEPMTACDEVQVARRGRTGGANPPTGASSAPEREYTREEMREACRNNYNAGAAIGADLVAKVVQLRADMAAMGNALADYFDNGSDYSTGAKVRAIAERHAGPK